MFSSNFPDDVQMSAQDFLDDYLFLVVGILPNHIKHNFCEALASPPFYEVCYNKMEKLKHLLLDPTRDPMEMTLIFVQVFWIFKLNWIVYTWNIF